MEIRRLTPARFDDLSRLFEARGGPKHCWCRVWRAALPGMNRGCAAHRRDLRKSALQNEVEDGVHAGLLAYEADVPVGWVSCGPKASFPRLTGGAGPEQTWAIVCFYVPESARNMGVMAALLEAAICAGRDWGADCIEAHPVTPRHRPYRFMGYGGLYRRAGFVDVGAIGKRRTVMQLVL